MKELLILMCYICVDGMSNEQISNIMSQFKREYTIDEKSMADISEKYLFRQFFVPIRYNPTRFELLSSKGSKDIPDIDDFIKSIE